LKPNLRLKHACEIVDDDPDKAHAICQDILRDDPEEARALFLVGTIHARADRYGTALACFERVTRLKPKISEAWNNLGMAYQECADYVKSAENFKRAIEIEPKASFMANLGSAYVSQGNYTEAMRWCKKSLDKEETDGAHATLGFAQLATGNWADGWKNYEYCLGGRFRKEVKVGDEPRWDGSPVDSLFIYGEQGLGDEIMYASILEDAQKHAKRITLECDKRLKGLFTRSFPEIEVYGTRRENQWWAHDRAFDAGSGIASLAALFRPDRNGCPRKPYLIADPERRLQWRALFDSWGKPVVGLTWSGGRAVTGRKSRDVGLEALRPYIEAHPEWQFVSLQYTDATEEIKATGLPVRHIPRASQSPDYDDTAAFVAELDHIVGIHTTVHHLAGGLGVPSTILVPSRPMWLYAIGDKLPWYPDQKLFRQRKDEAWADCVKRLCSA
jgi:hypothetical protein